MTTEPLSTLEATLAVVSIVLSIVNTWGLFIVKGMREEIAMLRAADSAMSEKMAVVRELVIGQYVTHQQFDTAMAAQTKQIMDRMDEMFRYLRPPDRGMHGDTRTTDRG